MSAEIQVSFRTGAVLYVLIRRASDGQIWNTASAAFQAYATANYTDYDIGLTQQGTNGDFFVGNFPTGITAPGEYSIVCKEQVGGTVAETDPTRATGLVNWTGSAVAPLSDGATSGQVGNIAPLPIAYGVALSGFMFHLVTNADHVTAFTSGVVSGQISRNGGAFGALQSGLAVGAYTERGLGWYSVNLTSGDLAGRTIALNFQAVGVSGGTADQLNLSWITQKTSGN